MPDQEKSNIICVFQLAACSGWLHAASSQFCGPYLLVCLVSTDACLEFWSKSCIHAMTDSWVPALQQPCFMPALEHLIWKHVWTHSGRNFEQYGGITVSCNCLRCSMWVPSWILASRPLQVVGCCNVLCECITAEMPAGYWWTPCSGKGAPYIFFLWAYLGLIFFAMQVCHKRMMQVSNPSPMLSLCFFSWEIFAGSFLLASCWIASLQLCRYH